MAEASRYVDLARLAARVAKDVGDAIAIDDVDIVTTKKGRANFATRADHSAEEAILRRLTRATPGVPVLAEESAKGEPPRGALWVVDPIDGTLNFSRGIPFYCIAIGYTEGRRTRAAAVYAPRTGELFAAHEGGGATLNGAAIHVAEPRPLGECFVVQSLAFRATTRRSSAFVAMNRVSARQRVIGSAALEICYVAAGRFDLFIHGALSPWDVAAPWLIAREAGALVADRDTGRAGDAFTRRVLIGHPKVVKEALTTVPELMKKG
jgi:myo-inositol-1(or 4)-monophosphatase